MKEWKSMGPLVVSAWKLGAVEPRRRLLSLVSGLCFQNAGAEFFTVRHDLLKTFWADGFRQRKLADNDLARRFGVFRRAFSSEMFCD